MFNFALSIRSFSWSANICGKKRWILYPPGEEENLKDIYGNLPYDVTSKELQDIKLYPNVAKACTPVEIIQEEGQIVFIPRYVEIHSNLFSVLSEKAAEY